MIDDRSLVERCIQKDLVAWDELVKKYSALIALSIKSRLARYSFECSRADIDDIRQNVLALIWKDNKLSSIKNRSDISYWLAIVSGNMAVDYIRHARARKDFRAVSLYETVGDECVKELVETIPSKAQSPADGIAHKEIAGYVQKALDDLTDRERLLIKLNVFHHKTHREISEITRTPIGTISSSLARSKEKLGKVLRKYMQEF